MFTEMEESLLGELGEREHLAVFEVPGSVTEFFLTGEKMEMQRLSRMLRGVLGASSSRGPSFIQPFFPLYSAPQAPPLGASWSSKEHRVLWPHSPGGGGTRLPGQEHGVLSGPFWLRTQRVKELEVDSSIGPCGSSVPCQAPSAGLPRGLLPGSFCPLGLAAAEGQCGAERGAKALVPDKTGPSFLCCAHWASASLLLSLSFL